MAKDANKPLQIGGVDVCFPHQPYGVQKVFMNQVVRAIDHEENALLEAPTGCGKTLSLLCGALAWQSAAKAKKAAAEQAAADKAAAAAEAKGAVVEDAIEDSSQGDTLCDTPHKAPPAQATSPAEPPEPPVIVPKIYYATRTHSQIAQVVRELKRTIYKPKMAVLGARPHYCINQAVIRKGNIDAECEELLKDGMGCKYKKNVNMISHRQVQVHDIEDLAKIGKRNSACPYFVARHLADSAELVFCPYSYLLDPNIRRSTRINAADAILVFDEAHNIEDQAREAGTMEVEQDVLQGSIMALVRAAVTSAEGDTYKELSDAMIQLINWVHGLTGGGSGGPGEGFRPAGFESFERIWNGQQMLDALSAAGLGAQDVERLWACYEKAKAAEEKAGFATEGDAAMEPVPADVKTPRAGGNALGCVASLLAVLRLMYGTYTEAPAAPAAAAGAGPGPAAAGGAAGGGAGGTGAPVRLVQSAPGVNHVTDYRLAVQMWLPRESNHNTRGRRDRRQPEASSASSFAETTGCAPSNWAFRVCLWCLNPAVVFRSLSNVARSVLLTSGTLSPLDSFSGELGLDFHVRLEAPHVVDVNRQVFARVVSHGLDNRKLRATYKEADQLDYQDSLGQLLLAVATTVPDGVLLFLPSYALMDKLSKRWQDTGLMAQLQRVKAVFSEPRQAGDAFDTAIRRYYEAVDEGGGGLFMAVCRGKVSEGIDFADGRARCVMVVGIPYPHAKDSKVALKKDYNNATATASARASMAAARPGPFGGSSSSNGPPRLLTGDAWYSQQAFRALNQAIGRCIRHRLDYGAILLVDERFKEGRNQTSLSKWVRGSIKPCPSTQLLLQDLGSFFRGLAAHPPGTAAPPVLPQHLSTHESYLQQQQMALALVKPGYEGGPGLPSAGAGGSCKPGFESAPGMAACAAGPPEQCCGADCMKPGFEPFAAAGGAAEGDARSKWRQPQLLPNNKQAWQQQQQQQQPQRQQREQPQRQQREQPGPQQQQQQQQGQQRVLGPMDAFLVKAAAKQQQKQQQGQVLQQQPAEQPPLCPADKQQHPQWGSAPNHHHHQPQQQQQQEVTQQQHESQQQGLMQQRGQRQAVSCLMSLSGAAQQSPCTPHTAEKQACQTQQEQPLRMLDSNVPSTPAGSSSSRQQQQPAHEHTPGSNGPGFASCSRDLAAAAAAAAAQAGELQPRQPRAEVSSSAAAGNGAGQAAASTGALHVEASGAARGDATASTAAAPGTAAVIGSTTGAAGPFGSSSSSSSAALRVGPSSLGIPVEVLLQWVCGDVGSMVQCLQHQQQAHVAAASGNWQLHELACFGLMASFEKAIDICQQQQACGGSPQGLAAFWQQWHSYVPTGLVAAAAAAGQEPPSAVVQQAQRAPWQGPWLTTMRQQPLQQCLTAMAELYDQVLEQQQLQQQQQQQQQERQGQLHGQWQQQQGGQHIGQQQPQQPCQQGWPPPTRGDMGPPHPRQQQRCLPASLRPQLQPLGSGGSSSAISSGPAHDGVMKASNAAGNSSGRHGPAGHQSAPPPAPGRAAGSGQRPAVKLQLSQSAQQPKRAAVLSAKAQLAAQKRSKLASGAGPGAVTASERLKAPAADSSDDDDDFI